MGDRELGLELQDDVGRVARAGVAAKEPAMSIRITFCLAVIAACSRSPHAAPAPDAPDANDFPRSVAGVFRVTSNYELAQAPASARPLFADLADATDDPDDPGR